MSQFIPSMQNGEQFKRHESAKILLHSLEQNTDLAVALNHFLNSMQLAPVIVYTYKYTESSQLREFLSWVQSLNMNIEWINEYKNTIQSEYQLDFYIANPFRFDDALHEKQTLEPNNNVFNLLRFEPRMIFMQQYRALPGGFLQVYKKLETWVSPTGRQLNFADIRRVSIGEKNIIMIEIDNGAFIQ